MRFGVSLVFALALAGAPSFAAAQSPVTTSDVQRLQDGIDDASRAIAQMRTRDATAAASLQAELDEVRDETTYMRVKVRKDEPVDSRELADLRDRVDSILRRARGESGGGYMPRPGEISEERPIPTAPPRTQNPNEIPVGTEFDVRLQSTLSSKTAQVEDRFDATTMVDLRDERGRVLVPAGSLMRGIVSSVNKATRTDRKGSLTVAFDRVTIDGRIHPIRATVSQALESEGIMGEKEKIGIGAGAGAIIGAILGGAKGALAGILIGGGGTIAATEGKDVELPAGTVLRVRLDSALNLQR
jgi:hypothetical protein